MITFREWLREKEVEALEEAEKYNIAEFVKWATDFFNNRTGNSTHTELKFSDNNILELRGDAARALLTLNLKNGNIKNEISKTYDKNMYEWAERILTEMQVSYWSEFGEIKDKEIHKKILRSAANISDTATDKHNNIIFRIYDEWYSINYNCNIQKYRAKKNIDPKIKKSIQDEWKKEKPNLKWYFKFY